MDNPETTQHCIGHKTQNKDKQKHTTQKTKKMTNMDPTKKLEVNPMKLS